MQDSLTFDIETIPYEDSELSEIQKEEIERKVDKYLSKNPGEDMQEAKRLIMGTSPYFGKIIVIGLLKADAQGDYETLALKGDDEQKILRDFWSILSRHKGLFISYNGLSFDVPFILKRSMKHQIPTTNRDFMMTYRFKKHPHFDVKEVISDYDRFAAPTLHLACDHVGVPSPKEGEVKASEVYDAYKEGRLQEIADYCVRDVKSTYEVYKKLDGYWV